MNRKIISLATVAALAVTSPAIARAQNPAPASNRSAAGPAAPAAGPTVSNSAVGVRRQATATANATAPAAEARLGAGRNVALMVVGGAALIIGAVIGGAPGVIIAVIGAAVGLYGLYNFVQ